MSETIGNTAVLVLGMHRSGTSSLAGSLQRLGVDLGSNLQPPQADNPKGFYEHTDFVRAHDAIFATLGTSWDDPCALPRGWQHDPRIVPFRREIAAIIARDFGAQRLWGVKDPRMCRLLPLWLEILSELKIEAKAAIIVRKPNEVAASLHKRDAIDLEHSLMLWLSHVVGAERYSRKLRRTIVLYDDLLADWHAEIERLSAVLEIDLFAFSRPVVDDVSAFLDTELRHHRDASVGEPQAPQNASARSVFDALVAWRRHGTDPDAACDAAADQLALAECTALPILGYAQRRLRAAADARAEAEAGTHLEAIRQLETALAAERAARAEEHRSAEAERAQHAESQAALEARLHHEAQTAMEAQLRLQIEARLRVEERARQDAQAAAEYADGLRAQVETASEALLRTQAEAAEYARISSEVFAQEKAALQGALTDAVRTQVQVEAEAAARAQRRAEAQAAVEGQLRLEARTAEKAQLRAEERASEAERRAEAEARRNRQLAAAVQDARAQADRYHDELVKVQQLVYDMRDSNSWRLTRPIRLASILLREPLKRLSP